MDGGDWWRERQHRGEIGGRKYTDNVFLFDRKICNAITFLWRVDGEYTLSRSVSFFFLLSYLMDIKSICHRTDDLTKKKEHMNIPDGPLTRYRNDFEVNITNTRNMHSNFSRSLSHTLLGTYTQCK